MGTVQSVAAGSALRYAYTIVLLKEGCGLLAVSRSLGHKKAAFTADVYAEQCCPKG